MCERGTTEFMLQQLKLFRPHQRDMFNDLSDTDLLLLYTQKDRVPEIASNGEEMTILDTIKMRINPLMCDIENSEILLN